ncbi:hypothetical protein E2986_10876 [Frieseomelitta varia]|uniref:Ig-like domain-containing protein n=1 Tax=Frieseomelitta varia TaxID=561572 RepID=A0A833R6R6_9HYME|nr:hypothetical protein E2986_10876 [Frieseomelitta varia]
MAPTISSMMYNNYKSLELLFNLFHIDKLIAADCKSSSKEYLNITQAKQMTSLLLLDDFCPVISYRCVQKKKKKKATNYCIRFGHSLWSANQLPAQGANQSPIPAKQMTSLLSLNHFYPVISYRRVQEKRKTTNYCYKVRPLVMVREPVASTRVYKTNNAIKKKKKKKKKKKTEKAGRLTEQLFSLFTDTLSLGDRTMDNMDRHASQNRPRNQLLADPSGLKPKVEPTFDYSQNTNVTALIGKTAYLTCKVRNLGDKTVSWVRHRDIHILTAGAYTYTSDQRFQALHRQNTGQSSEWSEWTLCIKWAQERDQGLYECQISTIPVKSHQFRLNVVGCIFGEFSVKSSIVQKKKTKKNTAEGNTVREWSFFIAVPTATILGGPELYVGAGSTINLTCAIHFSSEPPAYIFWYYNENVLSYDSPRGGVSVITEKGGDVTTSWLLIQTAQPSDSGEYSCKPSNANTASIKVHVLNDSCPSCLSTENDLPCRLQIQVRDKDSRKREAKKTAIKCFT